MGERRRQDALVTDVWNTRAGWCSFKRQERAGERALEVGPVLESQEVVEAGGWRLEVGGWRPKVPPVACLGGRLGGRKQDTGTYLPMVCHDAGTRYCAYKTLGTQYNH